MMSLCTLYFRPFFVFRLFVSFLSKNEALGRKQASVVKITMLEYS